MNCEYYFFIDRIKNEYIKKAKKAVSDKDYDFDFGNNKKYHYIIVTKPNVSLAKNLSNSVIFKMKN